MINYQNYKNYIVFSRSINCINHYVENISIQKLKLCSSQFSNPIKNYKVKTGKRQTKKKKTKQGST